jgi:hypothetical protein
VGEKVRERERARVTNREIEPRRERERWMRSGSIKEEWIEW